jgi:low affinity Fe/Cu permease
MTGAARGKASNGGSWFHAFARRTAMAAGRPATFVVAVLLVLVWALSGPLLGFSDSWQLIINTGTTVITFLVVLLIQNTQNRDTTALHLKLDELIRVTENARNRLVTLEMLDDDEIAKLRDQFEQLARRGGSLGAPNAESQVQRSRRGRRRRKRRPGKEEDSTESR